MIPTRHKTHVESTLNSYSARILIGQFSLPISKEIKI